MEKTNDLKRFKDVPEGLSQDYSNSYMFHEVVSRNNGRSISYEKIKEYDINIQKYVKSLSLNRNKEISLKYFQYLAILFTEIYLDRYFQNPVEFLNDINDFANKHFPYFNGFARNDLRKIVYWMATGSGKTFLMHINYWQFLKYNKGFYKIPLDNVILITLTNDLSEQHFNELKQSNIDCQIFQGVTKGYFTNPEEDFKKIKIIDIYKLRLPEDKKGEGVTLDISLFGSNNLIFVDEGHKGHSSEDRKWKKIRSELSKRGFVFEYSATFGQAINSGKEEDFEEYSKAILFDYSYKFFYSDGYGKDFRVLNLDPTKFNENLIETILLANTISFFEQKHLFLNKYLEWTKFNLSNPLWIFIGHRVQEDASDLLKIIQYFSRLLNNPDNWVGKTIESIMNGKSGMVDKNGKDVFARRNPERNLSWLRHNNYSSFYILNNIYRLIFNIQDMTKSKKLQIIDIKNSPSEIGLKAGNWEIFGIINIGNKLEFLKLLRDKEPDLLIQSDVFLPTLFDKVENNDTKINILIGAKKFIEGWNSWRVSSMCLLNVGRQEGSQIIQLFGRGVRLKGKEFSLKRSNFITPSAPEFIDVLETLLIYGIRATYMEIFKSAIEKEEVVYEEIVIPTQTLNPFPSNLFLIRSNKGINDFKKEKFLTFKTIEDSIVKLDLTSKVEIIDSRKQRSLFQYQTNNYDIVSIDKSVVKLLDWDDIYYEITRYKKDQGWSNLLIKKETLHNLINNEKYEIKCDKKTLEISNFESLQKIKEIVISILKKSIRDFYTNERKKWEKENLELYEIENNDKSINASYSIKVKESDTKYINEIQNMVCNNTIYSFNETFLLKNFNLNVHLYCPLLSSKDGSIIITPPGINKGEHEFMEDLKNHLFENKSKYSQVPTYVLRNLTRGKGIGFFDMDTFYPDFILWIKHKEKQVICFIDPKGLIFVEPNSPKLTLYKYLQKEIMKALGNPNILLNSFIISDTPYDEYKQRFEYQQSSMEELEKRHILFQYKREGVKNTNYIERMFDIINNESNFSLK